jgi:hypothetical protein
MRAATLLQPKRIALAAIVFGITALLTIVLRDTVRALVVDPLAQLLWLLGLIAGIFPQRLLLLLIVGIGAVAAAITALDRRDTSPIRAYRAPLDSEQTSLTRWMMLAQNAPGSTYAAERISAELRRVAAFRLTGSDATRALVDAVEDGALTVPPDVRELILGTPTWMSGAPRLPISDGVARVLERIGILVARQWTPQALDRLRGVVDYLEGLDQSK